jgi:hypothetical protein
MNTRLTSVILRTLPLFLQLSNMLIFVDVRQVYVLPADELNIKTHLFTER